MRKSFALLLVLILTVLSLIEVKIEPVLAQSVPEFTLKLVAHPFDVPPTYGIDQYTGKNVTIQEGYHVENKSIEITIRNQPASNLFYNVRYKGHFGESWTELYSYSQYSSGSLPPQSSSEYTVLSIPAVYPFVSGAQIDFQVEAQSWGYVEVWVSDHPMAPPPINEIGHYEQRFTLGTTSGWSNTQTVTFAAIPPSVTLLSPQEGQFNTSDVPLDFVVDQPASKITYSLDGQENVTVSSNTTLAGLSEGLHNITVYAWDLEGNVGDSETVYFTIAKETESELFPITLIVIAIVIIAIGGVALLVYFRKIRKRRNE